MLSSIYDYKAVENINRQTAYIQEFSAKVLTEEIFKVLYPTFYKHSKNKGFVGKYSVFIDGRFDMTSDSIKSCSDYIKEVEKDYEDIES